jgi:RNA polymerase sigma-70 factor (ECF subfamily)
VTGVDPHGLERALRDSSPALLAYFERRASDRADAADMLGELMLQAWRRTAALPDEPERQRMWLFTMARHVLANHRRSARNRHALVEKVRAVLHNQGDEPDIGAAADVRDAVLRLPERQRELVMLVHWDRFTIVEAAELMDTNPSTARSRYAAARIALREALGETTGS